MVKGYTMNKRTILLFSMLVTAVIGHIRMQAMDGKPDWQWEGDATIAERNWFDLVIYLEDIAAADEVHGAVVAEYIANNIPQQQRSPLGSPVKDSKKSLFYRLLETSYKTEENKDKWPIEVLKKLIANKKITIERDDISALQEAYPGITEPEIMKTLVSTTIPVPPQPSSSRLDHPVLKFFANPKVWIAIVATYIGVKVGQQFLSKKTTKHQDEEDDDPDDIEEIDTENRAEVHDS